MGAVGASRGVVPQVVIVHDYLIQMGGAEQVVAALHRIYPKAPIYTSLVDQSRLMKDFSGATLIESWMRDIPRVYRDFKKYFLLYPAAFKSFGQIPGKVALISSSGFSKWALFGRETTTICYCYTPPRFFWNPGAYLEHEVESGILKKTALRLLAPLRDSDYQAAQKIDHFVAISKCVQERILRCYGRSSEIIYPPVKLDEFSATGGNDGYYLIASRLVSYKRIDLVIKAFAKNGKRLIVLGDGPDIRRLKSLATTNVEFKGWTTRESLIDHMQRAYAFIFPGLEDFGIAPVEANACGKPVIAFAAGGALETIIPDVTGVLFHEQTPEAINEKIEHLEKINWNAPRIRENAERFSEARFAEEIQAFIKLKSAKARKVKSTI